MAAEPQLPGRSAHPASLLPLPRASCIRVLHLESAASASAISGSLHLADLADPHFAPYEAISYTWGPEPTPECPAVPITISGQQVFIRQNLYEALQRLRSNDHVTILWNDFLCITQDDLDEKAAQVAMIGDVFRKADRVRVWIGEHEHGSEQLFRGWPEHSDSKQDGRAMNVIKGFDRMVLRRSELTRDESLMRTDVWARFFGRRYWGRCWIVQEVYQAKELVVHCGGDQMSWEDLISNRFSGENQFDGIALRAVLNVPESAQFGDKIIGKIKELNDNRRGRDDNDTELEGKGILYFTQHFSTQWCSVPHDKVYGFLSMEGAEYRKDPLTIDYRISLPELLISVYDKRLVRCDETLDLARWKRTLPEADAIIISLRLNQMQRMEALRMAADRATSASDGDIKMRWQYIYDEFEFAIDKLWRRDRSIDGLTDENYGPNLKWDHEASTNELGGDGKGGDANNKATELVESSAKSRSARLRFNGDQYYLKIPTPFTRKANK